MAGKQVQSQAAVPGEGPQDASGRVGGHYLPPASSGSDRTPEFPGTDIGASVRQEPQTTVPGSAASEAWRGGGTP